MLKVISDANGLQVEVEGSETKSNSIGIDDSNQIKEIQRNKFCGFCKDKHHKADNFPNISWS